MPIGRIGQDFIVNTTGMNNQYEASTTKLADDRVVVTWMSSDTGDGSGTCVRARLYTSNGAPLGNDFVVASTLTENQTHPTVTALADGRFTVTWMSDDRGDGSGSCIRGRLFNADGNAAGNDFIVNSTTQDAQYTQSIASLADGRFIVTWYSLDLGDGSGSCIRARLFESSGSPAGDDFVVNTTTSSNQVIPSTTGLAHGGFVVTSRGFPARVPATAQAPASGAAFTMPTASRVTISS
jgi:hypothetical protein